VHYTAQLMQRSSQSVSRYCWRCLNYFMILPDLNFVKICFPKSKWSLKNKVKVNVLHLNDKMKILDLLKGGMCLVEVGWYCGKNESGICSIVCILSILSFPQRWSLWNHIPMIPRVYCSRTLWIVFKKAYIICWYL
jgi:hypothetical protein